MNENNKKSIESFLSHQFFQNDLSKIMTILNIKPEDASDISDIKEIREQVSIGLGCLMEAWDLVYMYKTRKEEEDLLSNSTNLEDEK